jgi:hypothetical protein
VPQEQQDARARTHALSKPNKASITDPSKPNRDSTTDPNQIGLQPQASTTGLQPQKPKPENRKQIGLQPQTLLPIANDKDARAKGTVASQTRSHAAPQGRTGNKRWEEFVVVV